MYAPGRNYIDIWHIRVYLFAQHVALCCSLWWPERIWMQHQLYDSACLLMGILSNEERFGHRNYCRLIWFRIFHLLLDIDTHCKPK